ncbi:hypothetical protein T4A_11764 [Trichinella pseudospiralis]|uniref:Uncharacterized protein n=1 Tax=Trichinella pseudospiralis TaxID=6337 RepID=A0A0V1F451_TRIPS|nr:hypothetical protein T4A_12842 [Trichinella pseudospiralis]KRY64583.1 hypothetical protein T4A_3545 [Trichinella pseudospiralis]KRY65360.1 hypothetical protein T4A_11764 [Trichinella pseudospiralis]KRY80609.1 hypothetical protein T4D_173 [Trichinella pseudospiralis]KRY80610.1 hypothetical protein T4D_4197 [Trichinella pseudospiralis]
MPFIAAISQGSQCNATNDKNSSQKIRNHEWTWSHVATLRISRHMAKSDMDIYFVV